MTSIVLPPSMFDPEVVGTHLSAMRVMRIVDARLSDAAMSPLQHLAAACPQLQEVDLSGNTLTALPTCIFRLEGLLTLVARGNRLTNDGVDAEPVALLARTRRRMRLRELDLSSNRLNSLPRLLAWCPRLRSLRLADNGITASDADGSLLGAMPALETLLLANNRLESVPASTLAALPTLRDLDLDNNELRSVEPVLGLSRSMRALRVSGNPQRLVRQTVIAQGPAAVIEFLRSRATDDDRDDFAHAATRSIPRLDALLAEEAGEAAEAAAVATRERDAAERSRLAARPGDAARLALHGDREVPPPRAMHRPPSPILSERRRDPSSPPRSAALASASSASSASAAWIPPRSTNVAAAAPRIREQVGASIAVVRASMLELEARLDAGGLSTAQQSAARRQLAALRAELARLGAVRG